MKMASSHNTNMMNDILKKELSCISKLSPNAYAFFSMTSNDELELDLRLQRWFEDEGLEFCVLYDLGMGFKYDIHYSLESENRVFKSQPKHKDFISCLSEGIGECFKTLEFKFSPKSPLDATYLDAVTVGAVKRDKQRKFFKTEKGKKLINKKRNQNKR